MNKDMKVITLCGSTKFKKEFEYWNKRLSLENNIVLSLPILSQVQLKKIDMSNEIFVIDVDGYIGNGTKTEINYAITKVK